MSQQETLEALLKLLHDQQKSKDCCGCGCPTEDMFESSAARWSERMSSIAAESMQSFVLQNAAQNANLIAQQSLSAGLPPQRGTTNP